MSVEKEDIQTTESKQPTDNQQPPAEEELSLPTKIILGAIVVGIVWFIATVSGCGDVGIPGLINRSIS